VKGTNQTTPNRKLFGEKGRHSKKGPFRRSRFRTKKRPKLCVRKFSKQHTRPTAKEEGHEPGGTGKAPAASSKRPPTLQARGKRTENLARRGTPERSNGGQGKKKSSSEMGAGSRRGRPATSTPAAAKIPGKRKKWGPEKKGKNQIVVEEDSGKHAGLQRFTALL